MLKTAVPKNGRFSGHESRGATVHRIWSEGSLAQALTLAAVFCEQRETLGLYSEYDNASGWSVLVIV